LELRFFMKKKINIFTRSAMLPTWNVCFQSSNCFQVQINTSLCRTIARERNVSKIFRYWKHFVTGALPRATKIRRCLTNCETTAPTQKPTVLEKRAHPPFIHISSLSITHSGRGRCIAALSPIYTTGNAGQGS